MASRYSNNKNEQYCNLDASVLALLRELPDDASVSQLHGRIAHIKLQQSTILGQVTYAAKILDQTIADGAKDRTAHSLLQERLNQLQDRIAKANRSDNNQADEAAASKQDSSVPPSKEDTTENKTQNDTDTKSDGINKEEHERLKQKLETEEKRANALEDLLVKQLTREVAEIKQEQEALQSHKARLRDRIERLETAIQQLPEDRGSGLRDQLGELTHQHTVHPQQACVVCHDHHSVWAVIPCGHLCLCDECLSTVENTSNLKKQCPVCRAPLLSTLKIYTTK